MEQSNKLHVQLLITSLVPAADRNYSTTAGFYAKSHLPSLRE